MLSLSVIVCAHTDKRWVLLKETIMSLRDQTRPPEQIILVIDNNPALLDRCANAFEGVMVCPNAGNGLSDGRNTGIAHATGDIIAFIDDDAVAEPDWAAQHIAAYENTRDSRIISVGGFISPRWETERPAWMPREFDWTISCTYEGMPTQRAEIRNGIGTNISFRRQAFDGNRRFVLGRKDGSIAYSNDETEFCIRLRQEIPNCKIIYEPSARVRHFVPAERGTPRYFLKRCFLEGWSKAKLSTLVGRSDSLSAERTYATRTLPLGVLRGIGDGARLQLSGFARAAMIVLGLASTTSGYALGMLKH